MIDDPLLILVDSNDNILGHKGKHACHQGSGLLHRAFSILIFNSDGELLLQRRSREKPLWPLFWSNSVCSHPGQGEDYDTATQRRLLEEIGITARLRFLFRFEYQAGYQDIGSEHELCSVYIGCSDSPIKADPGEIDSWKYIPLDELDQDLASRPELYTPWFRMEWQRIRQHHMDDVQRLLAGHST